MRHLTHNSSLEIWVLEDGERTDSFRSDLLGFLSRYPKLSDLTEEQYAILAAQIMHSPRTIDSVKINTDLVLDEIDQLLKENSLHGLRVGERPDWEDFVIKYGHNADAYFDQANIEHDSKVPPENIVIRVA